jgi:hypothetical protein
MTVEEIKQEISMPDLVRRYGIQIHNGGMVSCPFHGRDRHPSMQIKIDRFSCYTCGAHGDIFTFTQMMENCSFKDAFLSLGGTYEHQETKTARAVSKSRIKAKKDQKHINEDIYQVGGKIYRELTGVIDWCRFIKRYHPPFTEIWCIAVNSLPELEYIYDKVFCKKDGNKEADGIYILTRCRQVKERIFSRARSVRRADAT